jgi:hypothetical protein
MISLDSSKGGRYGLSGSRNIEFSPYHTVAVRGLQSWTLADRANAFPGSIDWGLLGASPRLMAL